MTDAIRVGSRIRKFRELMGLSKSELARRVGVSPTAVHNWEENGVMPRIETLMEIGDALQMDVVQLVARDEHDEPSEAPPAPGPVSRQERLDELKEQVAQLYGVSRSRVEITIRI
jgi:transcriptional regulator with XRE-family HTH domain